MNKQLQFEIWEACNNKCTFCYLGKENRCTPDELKLSALKKVRNKIADKSLYPEYNTLAFIGGEFFQGQLNNPEVKSEFMELMKDAANLLNQGIIEYVWICATLTIGDQKDLYETLNLFPKKDGVWILTSWDTKGRFHTEKMLENWQYHMKKIHELYPEIKLNTTSILTGDLINKYLNNEFTFKELGQEYNTEFFLKQCGLGAFSSKEKMNEVVGDFFPKRKDFLKFLSKFKRQESELLWNKLFNVNYRADTLYRNFNDKNKQMSLNIRNKNSKSEVEEASNENECLVNPKCGHSISYQAYIDSNKCVLCDKQMIEGTADERF